MFTELGLCGGDDSVALYVPYKCMSRAESTAARGVGGSAGESRDPGGDGGKLGEVGDTGVSGYFSAAAAAAKDTASVRSVLDVLSVRLVLSENVRGRECGRRALCPLRLLLTLSAVRLPLAQPPEAVISIVGG